MTEHRSLRVTAILICIIAVLIAALSGLCSIVFAANARTDILALFAIGAIGFVPFGLLAFAMFRHIKHGPNLISEIIAMVIGLVVILSGLILFGIVAGTPSLMNIVLALPGFLIFGWGVWSFSVRSKPSIKDSSDPFT